MMTDNQRNIIIDNYVRGLLNSDRHYKNYDYIEKLWNASGLTNKDLVDELMSDRENASPDFRDSVFWDMIWLLKNAIMRDAALKSLFSDLYSKRYPEVDKYIKELESKISSGKKVIVGSSDFRKFHNKKNLDKAGYFVFRIYNSDIIVSNDCIEREFWEEDYRHAKEFPDREAQIGDNSVRFTDETGDAVFASKIFERYVKKQRQGLADYLGVEEEKLSETYDSVMTIHEAPEEEIIHFNDSGFGVIAMSTIEMMRLHGGISEWLINIQSLNRKNKLGYRYRPDFDKLFERYCKTNVWLIYKEHLRDGEDFTPFILSRECDFDNMEALAESMGYMYMCDCVYQMYVQMQKQYYENFSWEKYRNRDLKARYESVIGDLKASLASRDHQLENLQNLYCSLKRNLEKQNDLALLNELQKKEVLLKECEDRDAEIERLKAIIASQNQMIDQLQFTPKNLNEDVSSSRFDKYSDNIVYRYRYLFVGDITSLGFEDLRKRFPSSIFMNTNTMSVAQIQVDAVVYLIQAMSHSMYYKCQNSPSLQDAKTIYFNGRSNLTSLLETIEREVQDNG